MNDFSSNPKDCEMLLGSPGKFLYDRYFCLKWNYKTELTWQNLAVRKKISENMTQASVKMYTTSTGFLPFSDSS